MSDSFERKVISPAEREARKAFKEADAVTAQCDQASPRYADLEVGSALKCRSCRKGQYAPPVHMIKLTERREIPPYAWVHPDEDR